MLDKHKESDNAPLLSNIHIHLLLANAHECTHIRLGGAIFLVIRRPVYCLILSTFHDLGDEVSKLSKTNR